MEQVNRFITAFIGVVGAFVIGVVGLVYAGLQWPALAGPLGVPLALVDAITALVLVVPYGLLGALALIRAERFAPWRQLGHAFLIVGGYILLLGMVEAVDDALRYPGLPDLIPPLVGLGYAGLLAWRLPEAPPLNPAAMLGGLGVGAVCAVGWALGGMLGIEVELAIATLNALSIGGVAWLLLGALPNEGPLAFTLLAGAIVTGALPALLAVYGAGLQTLIVWGSLLFAGLAAAAGTAYADEAAGAGLLAGAVGVPLALTEAVEIAFGLVPPEYGLAVVVTLGASLLVAVVAFALAAFEAPTRPLPAGVIGVPVVIAAYAISGGQWFQPHTYMVVMADQPDTSPMRQMDDLTARRAAVYEELTRFAAADQEAVRGLIGGRSHTPFYIVNAIEVQGGGAPLRLRLALHPDVGRTLTSPRPRPVRNPPTMPAVTDEAYSGPPPWGIEAINAEQVWEEFGVRGEGVVVGSADSGVAWSHPALREGYLGGPADHTLTWLDPWQGTSTPTDTNGHGTHTIGTAVGRTGVGVAPAAGWIGCRNLARNLGNPAYYLSCMEFLFAPGGDVTRGADIVNNSWGCPPEEGCDADLLPAAVRHLADAGQLNVFGAGNDGPRCGTIYGASLVGDAITVGAVDRSLTVTAFSSRGEGTTRTHLDVSAPGAGVLSAVPDGYATFDGTSMAAPHVAGTAALMWSANPALRGEIEATERMLREAAMPAAGEAGSCGSSQGWDQAVGYGVLDAYEAVRLALDYAE